MKESQENLYSFSYFFFFMDLSLCEDIKMGSNPKETSQEDEFKRQKKRKKTCREIKTQNESKCLTSLFYNFLFTIDA